MALPNEQAAGMSYRFPWMTNTPRRGRKPPRVPPRQGPAGSGAPANPAHAAPPTVFHGQGAGGQVAEEGPYGVTTTHGGMHPQPGYSPVGNTGVQPPHNTAPPPGAPPPAPPPPETHMNDFTGQSYFAGIDPNVLMAAFPNLTPDQLSVVSSPTFRQDPMTALNDWITANGGPGGITPDAARLYNSILDWFRTSYMPALMQGATGQQPYEPPGIFGTSGPPPTQQPPPAGAPPPVSPAPAAPTNFTPNVMPQGNYTPNVMPTGTYNPYGAVSNMMQPPATLKQQP